MPDFPSSQGSTVFFGGVPIGSLTGFRALPGTAQFEETTHVESTVLGTGANSRVVKTYDCVAIEPGGADVTLFGCPPFIVEDIGLNGDLAIEFDGGSLDLNAYLESFEITGSVGELLAGTARFRFSGITGS